MRYFMIWNATDEQLKNLDRDYPSAPIGFSDYHTPEDFDESHPHFANYLRRKGYEPFRLRFKDDLSIARETRKEEQPEV